MAKFVSNQAANQTVESWGSTGTHSETFDNHVIEAGSGILTTTALSDETAWVDHFSNNSNCAGILEILCCYMM